MSKFIDLMGQWFGHYRVLNREPSKGGSAMWRCRCDCGEERIVRGDSLRCGKSRSCGCMQLKHGHRSHGKMSREYRAWHDAKERCYCPRAGGFRNYGSRGISMCPAWRDSFVTFYRDMGPCPDGRSLDRIDVDGNYEPGNCRWATRVEQARNRRSNRYLECGGIRQTLTEWAAELGMAPYALKYRVDRGITLASLIERSRQMPMAA
jgi:hypothetical protein